MSRYSRQEVLKHIGEEGQRKLGDSSVTIVGVGSTGTVSAELLARAGAGNIRLIDHDVVEESNLNRQLLYSEEDVGEPKARAAARRLREINSDISIEAEQTHLAHDNTEVLESDLILDCTDNMETRLIINDYSRRESVPWIYAAAVEDRGLVYVTTPGNACFKCLFEKAQALEDCETAGILNTASTQVASIQATQALKYLLGEEPSTELIHVNVWKSQYEKYKVTRKEDCPACNGDYEHLRGKSKDYVIEYCKSKAAMSAKPQKSVELDMDKLKQEFNVKADADIVAVVEVDGAEVVVHDYGELLFKDEEDEERLKELAERVYSVAK